MYNQTHPVVGTCTGSLVTDQLSLSAQQCQIFDQQHTIPYQTGGQFAIDHTAPFPYEKLAEAELLRKDHPLINGTNEPEVLIAKKNEIRAYFHKTYSLFEALHDHLLNDNIFYYQPERLRHPLVFYFGHTAVFYINKLNIAGHIKRRVDKSIESMCAIGVDEMSWDDLNPSHYNWPTIDRLRQYRKDVRQLIDDLIIKSELKFPITWDSPFWIILMGTEHENIHLETSSVLFRQLPPQFVRNTTIFKKFQKDEMITKMQELNNERLKANNQYLIQHNQHIINGVDITKENVYYLPTPGNSSTGDENNNNNNTPENQKDLEQIQQNQKDLEQIQQNYNTFDNNFLHLNPALIQKTKDRDGALKVVTKSIPRRVVTLGKGETHHFYGWDNEFGVDTENVETFEISTQLTTNQQFLHFMLSGGYYDKRYWTTEEGWRFAQYKTNVLKMPWPTFWYPVGVKLDSLNDLATIDHQHAEQYDYYCGMSYPQPTAAILEGTSAAVADVKESNSNNINNNNNNNNTNNTSDTSPIIALGESSNLSTPRISTSSTDGLTQQQQQQHCDFNKVETDSNNNASVIQNQGATSTTTTATTIFNSTMRVHGLPFNQINHLYINNFKWRWLGGLCDMEWDLPVDINNLESQAYAKFVELSLQNQKNQNEIVVENNNNNNNNAVDDNTTDTNSRHCRLPTEFEYNAMRSHIVSTYGELELQNKQQQQQQPKQDINNNTNENNNNNSTLFDYPLTQRENVPTYGLIQQNIALTHGSACPVDIYQYLNSGFYDVIGNVWQHCCSVIYPFKHFKVHPAYDDFTVPTYDNMHAIIAGGSWVSRGNEANTHARYAFRRHFYQHAGCRVGFFTTQPKSSTLQSIEQDPQIANMIHNDFYDLLANDDLVQCETPYNKQFLQSRDVNSKQTAKMVYKTIQKLLTQAKEQENDGSNNNNDGVMTLKSNYTMDNILVLGCRGGRLPIELASLFYQQQTQQEQQSNENNENNNKNKKFHIMGVDTTTRLIGAGIRQLEGLQVSYLLKTSYDQTNFIRIRENGLKDYLEKQKVDLDYIKSNISLIQTDVVNLPEDKVAFNAYNLIIVDCLDTCYDPKVLLENLTQHCVNSGDNKQSIIALCIYHTWEQQTNACNNVWGYRDETNGEFIDVERGIGQIVPHWSLLKKVDYNHRVRRVNERIYQHIDMTCYFYLNQKE